MRVWIGSPEDRYHHINGERLFMVWPTLVTRMAKGRQAGLSILRFGFRNGEDTRLSEGVGL